jgi:hypothetical protein
MLLSAVSVLDVAQPSSEVPEGLMNYPVYEFTVCLLSRVVCDKALDVREVVGRFHAQARD